MNKKGYYFTLTVIILLGLVTAYYMSFSNPGNDKRALVDQERLQEINTFLESAQEDANNALSITSKRAFLAFEQDYLRPKGEYIPSADIDDLFEELIMSGSIDSAPAVLMVESTLTSWELEVKNLGLQYGLQDVNFIWDKPRIWQEDAWNVLVEVDYLLQANDTLSDAKWNISGTATSSVSIIGLYDPLYTIETNQNYFQLITKSNQTFPDGILDHLAYHQYLQINHSPSFLQRLVGDISAAHDQTGIESLVDVPTLMDHGVDYTNRALSDWHYFGYGSYTKVCTHASIWWVYVKERHNDYYHLPICGSDPPEDPSGPIHPIELGG